MTTQKSKALFAAALIGMLIASVATQSIPQVFAKEGSVSIKANADVRFDEFEIVKVRAKQGKTLTILFVKMAEDIGIDIYQFSVKLTGGELKGFKGPKTWMGERDRSDASAVTFYTKERPITAERGAIFRILAVNSCPAIEWTAMDEDGEEIDYGTVIAQRSASYPQSLTTCPVPTTPIPTPRPMPMIAIKLIEADVITAGAKVVIAGKGFTANSAVKIMFNGRAWVQVDAETNGSFVTRAVVPVVTEGEYKITATDSVSISASISIYVHVETQTPPPSDPDPFPGLRIWTDAKAYVAEDVVIISGQGLPDHDTRVVIMDPNGEENSWWTFQTGPDGHIEVKAKLGTYMTLGTYTVLATQGEAEARTSFQVISEVPIPPDVQLSIWTEASVYTTGDRLIIHGKAEANASVEWQLINPNGEVLFRETIQTEADGKFSIIVGLSETAAEGEYVIYAKQGRLEAKATFIVKTKYRPIPVPLITVKTDKDRYHSNAEVTIYGRVNANVASNIQAIVNIAVIGPYPDSSANLEGNLIFKDTVRVTAGGHFKTSFKLDDAREGKYVVIAQLGTSAARASFVVVGEVTPPVEPTCPSGSAEIRIVERSEGYVRIDGRNFSAGSTITLTIEGTDTGSAHFGRTKSDSQCGFENFWASISDLPVGVHVITAADLNGNTASVKLVVE